MNIGKQRNKLALVRHHRMMQYLKAINDVIDNKVDPSYATLRWQKLKDLKQK
jgi:hypothetical protein